MEKLPVITSDKAKGEISLALTRQQMGIQKIQSVADSLVFNEDQESIEAIKFFNEKTKAVIKAIEVAHFEGKNPYRQAAEAWDTAKRETLAQIETITKPIATKYQILANEIQRKAREKEAKEAREKEIRTGVENSIIEYSKRIAAAQTVEELTKIELSISNQKSPSAKAKYGDLHQEAIDAYNSRIIPLLKEKKEGLISLGEMETEFGDTGDLEQMEELGTKIEQKRNEITYVDVKVQENALNQSFVSTSTYTEILPTVKPKRTTPEYRLVDYTAAIKKAPECLYLTEIPLVKDRCREIYDRLVKEGKFDKADKVVVDGIEYRQKKVY